MNLRQRYVSDELTHFVGRGLSSEEDQYRLLVHVLEERVLLHPRYGRGGAVAMFEFPGENLDENARFSPNAVCFCDIPQEGLDIHMQKYSRFGLAFPRDLLVRAGANPVFYVARSSIVSSRTGTNVARGEYFRESDSILQLHFDQILSELRRKGKSRELDEALEIEHWIKEHILSFLKFFDPEILEDDPDNFYMEREWRCLGPIEFDLSQLSRVLVPMGFDERLRIDVPKYTGSITIV